MQLLINGFSMSFTDAGHDIPLVLVHGYPLNRAMWQPQVEGLSDIARIIAPDLRGHGDSQAVSGPYSMDRFADDLYTLLDTLQVAQKIVLCGLSMGGYVAFAFYRKYPERVAGLILTSTRAGADSPEGRAARDQAADLARAKGVPAIVEGMLPRLLSPVTYKKKPHLVEQAREIMLRTSLQGVLGDLAGMKERPDSTPTLAHITVPTLLLPGADDQIIPLADAQAMQAGIPGAQLKIIPNAGHLPNLENPAAFNRAVRRFLKAL